MTLVLLAIILFTGCNRAEVNPVVSNNYPDIYPDYINVTIPPNIAPLNFRVNGDCKKVHVILQGKSTRVSVKSGNKIIIPPSEWRKLLNEQKNDSISVGVTVLDESGWTRYKSFSIFVSPDKIDPFLSYRLIEPGYEVYHNLRICERNLETYRERVLADNNLLENGCINCHTYSMQDPGRSFFHIRQKDGGTMIAENGKFRKLNTKTDSTISAGVYGNWSPDGKYIVFSTNVIIPEFHSINNLRIEVYDTISDVVVLDLARNEVIKNKLLAGKDYYETFPAFSADGKKIIFCSAKAVRMPQFYNQIRYSLCSVDFDPVNGTFGATVDTLVSSYRTGKTISEPKPSPDGKYILYTSFAYGNFPVWHREANLNLLRLQDMTVDTLPMVNSAHADSYHSWSSDSRWIVFASKRDNGMYGKLYFAHIGEDGVTSRPFVLPQKDPDFYDFFMKSYNIPELAKGTVPWKPSDVEKAFLELKAEPVKFVRR